MDNDVKSTLNKHLIRCSEESGRTVEKLRNLEDGVSKLTLRMSELKDDTKEMLLYSVKIEALTADIVLLKRMLYGLCFSVIGVIIFDVIKSFHLT